MKKVAKIFFCLLILVVSSCQKVNAPDCLTPNGDEISELRDLSEFRSIELTSDIDVKLFQGATQKVEVIAGEYIIDKINTTITNGVLLIENLNRCNFVRGYKRTIRVNITLPYVSQITNDGVGDLVFDPAFKQDSVLNLGAGSSGDIHVNGSFDMIYSSSHGNGDLYFEGTANQLILYTNGINYTFAQNLDVKDYIYIATYSLGDVYIKCNSNNVFDYNIWKDGNIYYSGTPKSINELSDGTANGKAIQID